MSRKGSNFVYKDVIYAYIQKEVQSMGGGVVFLEFSVGNLIFWVFSFFSVYFAGVSIKSQWKEGEFGAGTFLALICLSIMPAVYFLLNYVGVMTSWKCFSVSLLS